MSAAPRVSVVIPTFNGERFLADTLRAVLAQSLEPIELIVVDDGSTDATTAVVAATAPSAQVVTQPNAGVSAARNHGLRLASGEFVVFLDQDDIWHPQMLQRQVAWLDAQPGHDVVVCPYQHWHPAADGSYQPPGQAWPALKEGADPDFTGWVYHQFLLDCWALTSGTLMRREAVLAVGGFDEALPYSEDWDLWIRMSQCSPFARLHWPVVLYRHHPVQGSRKPRERDFRCELLQAAVLRYGQASPDGRSLPPGVFERNLARYRAEFGRHHLLLGRRRTGIAHLWRAWCEQPRQWRWLAQAALGALGWRPRA
jgi:GT2 family glycosyltransferase